MEILLIVEASLNECTERISSHNACPQVAVVCCTPFFTENGCKGARVGVLAVEREGEVVRPHILHQLQPKIFPRNMNH